MEYAPNSCIQATSHGNVWIVKMMRLQFNAENALIFPTIKAIVFSSKELLVVAVIVEILMRGKLKASAQNIKVLKIKIPPQLLTKCPKSSRDLRFLSLLPS